MGAIAMSDAADNLAQNRPSGLEYEAMSVASVPALAALRFRLQKASFHDSTRHKRPVDARPPMPSGSSTRRTSCHSVAPSMRAASRISRGMSLKCEYSIQTMMGRLDSANTMISASCVSSRWLFCAST